MAVVDARMAMVAALLPGEPRAGGGGAAWLPLIWCPWAEIRLGVQLPSPPPPSVPRPDSP